MAAPQKVSTQDLVNALLARRGNVQAAADDLGLTRNGLYARIERLGLDLAGFRSASANVVSHVNTVPSMPSIARQAVHAPKSARAHYSDLRGRSIVSPVASATAEDLPIRAVPQRQRPLRLKPAHQDRLRDAKLDFGARYRIETNENAILEQFFDEAFEQWLQSKLAPHEQTARKGSKGEK
jgi:Bacterial regulatory protein, Fis family